MDLLEYQAKQLFRQVGIPVLPSETIAKPRDLKQLQIPYPVVLKSQVKVGGRAKAGGIRFVTNTIDAIAAAREIFNLSILGEYPNVVLAEAQYHPQQEIFLAITIDYQLQYPVIFGSIYGGIDLELLQKNLHQVAVEQTFSPFIARSLGVKMGLKGELLLSVSTIIEKMYELFQAKDLALIEINPLAVDILGNLMALDGKITIDNRALARHPEIIDLVTEDIYTDSSLELAEEQTELSFLEGNSASIRWLDWQDSKGKVAILTDDEDLALLSWDLIKKQKEKPACAVVIEQLELATEIFLAELQQLWQTLRSQGVLVVFINLWATQEINQLILQTIEQHLIAREIDDGNNLIEAGDRNTVEVDRKRESAEGVVPHQKLTAIPDLGSEMQFVIRLAVENITEYKSKFDYSQINWTKDLTEAIKQTISLSKTK